jgi:short-subunit dehydrogenase
VRGFSEALWTELKQHGIGVTSVHPAGVRTNIARSARSTQEELKKSAVDLIEENSVAPERCAELIVNAIKKNKMRQLVKGESYVIDALKRFSPGLPARIVQYSYSRGALFGRNASKSSNRAE